MNHFAFDNARLITGIMCVTVGSYMLYVTRKHWKRTSGLTDNGSNRGIKGLFACGILFVLLGFRMLWSFVESR